MSGPPYRTIQLRRDTAANWTASNPILALGEKGLETDTLKEKVGDGVNNWNALAYWNVSAGGGGFTGGVSTGGNTLGNTGTQTGQFVLVGGNNVTLSVGTAAGGAQTITVSGPNTVAQSAQPVAISGSNGSFAFSTLTMGNLNGASFYTSNGSLVASYTVPSQTSNAFSAGAASSTFQTLSFQDTNNFSFSNNAGQIRANHNLAGTSTGFAGANISGSITHNSSGINLSLSVAAPGGGGGFTGGVSTGGNTAGNTGTQTGQFILVGGNNITLSVGTAAAGAQTITISGAAAGGAQTGISGIAASNTTYTSGSVTFSGVGGGVTVNSNTGQRVDISVAAQSVQPVAISGSNGSFAFSTVTFGNLNGLSHYTSNGSVVGSYTVPSQTNVAFSAGAASSTFQTLSFQDTNNVSFSNNAGQIRITHALAGTSTGFAGANISGSITHNSSGINLSLSVAAPGAAAENNWFNLLGANTAGNTTASGSTIGLSGLGVTLSGTNGSVIVVSGGGGGGAAITQLSTQNRFLGASTNTAPGQNSVWIAPYRQGNAVSASTALLIVSYTGSVTSNQTNTVGVTQEIAFYTAPESNQSSFSRLWSTSFGQTFWNSGTVSVSYASGTYTTSSAGSNLMTASIFGLRLHTFTINSTFNAGLYAYGYRQSTSSAGNSSILRTASPVYDNPLPVAGGFMGSATNNSLGYADGGTWSATSGTLPATFNLTDVGQVMNRIPFIKYGAI